MRQRWGLVPSQDMGNTQFDNDLVEIDRRVTELFGLVASALSAATDAFLASDTKAAHDVVQRDKFIDALYAEIEGLIQRCFTLQTPLGADMRYLLSMLRIVPELERSGDLIEHIASRGARQLAEGLTPRIRGLVERMGLIATDLWVRARQIYIDRDNVEAGRLRTLDDELDDLHSALLAEIVDAELSLPLGIEMALVARFYERLGDHAVNVTNRLRYAMTGASVHESGHHGHDEVRR
jgi:phosphate transport system protein